jgi:hypothetical protein
MESLMPIHVYPNSFKKIQKLALFAGSEAAAVDRLLAYWECDEQPAPPTLPQSTAITPKPPVAIWRSPTGDELRVGEQLEGEDGGETHYALVEQTGIRWPIKDGKLYDSPSAAAVAVKNKRGLVGKAASTNGRTFWRVRDPSTGRPVAIRDLRPPRGIDVEALLAQLDIKPQQAS